MKSAEKRSVIRASSWDITIEAMTAAKKASAALPVALPTAMGEGCHQHHAFHRDVEYVRAERDHRGERGQQDRR